MAGAPAQADPSMEAILASIRKIIQEDDGSPVDEAALDAVPESQDEAKTETGSGAPDEADQNDVDALFAQSAEAQTSTEAAFAAEDKAVAEKKKVGVSDVVDDDTVLLTADMRNREASKRLQPTSSNQQANAVETAKTDNQDTMPNISDVVMPMGNLDDDLDDDFDESKGFELVKGVDEGDLEFVEYEPEPAPSPIECLDQNLNEDLDKDLYKGALTSPAVGAEVSGYLSSLTRIKAPESPGTIEDLVASMLNPMLKAWLDANLPAIVEQKVADEIRRLAKK